MSDAVARRRTTWQASTSDSSRVAPTRRAAFTSKLSFRLLLGAESDSAWRGSPRRWSWSRAITRRPESAALEWLSELGDDVAVGIEGGGSYGAGLCEFLLAEGIQAVEVERPRREDRRRGKSDEIDALLAAKKVLAGDGLSTPRAVGTRQALSALLVAYRSCVAERTRLLNQLQALHVSAPLALRERIGPGNGKERRPEPRAAARADAVDRLLPPPRG